MSNQDIESLKNYLNIMYNFQKDTPYGQFNKLILDKGTEFIGYDNSNNYEEAVSFKKYKRPKAKECFYNAQLFAVHNPDVVEYYEGFIVSIIPILHAWNVINGNVVDLAMEVADKILKREWTPAYLGVKVPTNFISKTLFKTKCTQPISALYYMGIQMI